MDKEFCCKGKMGQCCGRVKNEDSAARLHAGGNDLAVTRGDVMMEEREHCCRDAPEYWRGSGWMHKYRLRKERCWLTRHKEGTQWWSTSKLFCDGFCFRSEVGNKDGSPE